ncbi:hypothetical protein [Nonomuraea sp. bgisy101]|uniref:hypothetical protein n=1 Tax=Nonomuraea sp. bgisy101 TaxID=3413784 RepID=UPI003D73775F
MTSARYGYGLGWFAIAAMLVGLPSVTAINQCGGSLTMISIRDSFRPVNPIRRVRAVTIAAMAVAVRAIAQLVGEERFNAFCGNLAYLLSW